MAKANHTRTVTKPMAVRRGVLLGALLSLAAPKTAPAAPVPPPRASAPTLPPMPLRPLRKSCTAADGP